MTSAHVLCILFECCKNLKRAIVFCRSRLGTLREAFYHDGKESGTKELRWNSVLRRVMSSFLTVPLLLVTTYFGAAHPAMLRWVRKLRPAVCLAIWALLITTAFNEPVRDTFLRPHTFVLLCIALFGLMLYIMLLPFYSAMSNGETTRGEERASTRELACFNTEGY